MKVIMRLKLSTSIALLSFSLLTACSTTSMVPTSSTVFIGHTWYDDYWDYWGYDSHPCCHHHDDFEDSVERWWDSLNQDERDHVRDELNDWLDEDKPDFSGIENALQRQWESLPKDKQQEIIEKGQKLHDAGKIMPVAGAAPLAGKVSGVELSDAQKANLSNAAQAKYDSLTPEQQAAAKQKIQSIDASKINKSAVQHKVQSMPAAQKTQLRNRAQQMKQQRPNINRRPVHIQKPAAIRSRLGR